MRKLNKWLIGGLITGILLTGIGCGVAFAEYSSFEYGGEKHLEGSEYFVKSTEYTFDIQPKYGEKEKVWMHIYDNCEVIWVEDINLDKETLRLVVRYLSDDNTVIPRIEPLPMSERENYSYFEEIYLVPYTHYSVNETEWYIRAKDQILEELKQRKISNYELDGVKKIEIHVNPDAYFEVIV